MDITGDGYHIIIHDPYQNPSVQIRRPHQNHYEQASWQLHFLALASSIPNTICAFDNGIQPSSFLAGV